MEKIPLIICSFNQLSYLKNLMLWWRFLRPDKEKNPTIIFDNGSTYPELIDFLETTKDAFVFRYQDNNFRPNLSDFLEKQIHPYYTHYILSDADIQPHPATPTDFVEIWKDKIDVERYHHVGFNLITDRLSPDLHLVNNVIYDESQLLLNPVCEVYGYTGYRSAIDTTFALYCTAKGGWYSPMSADDWSNSLRLFEAYHMMWYLRNELNDEMKYYFDQAKYRVVGSPSAGSNNSRPMSVKIDE